MLKKVGALLPSIIMSVQSLQTVSKESRWQHVADNYQAKAETCSEKSIFHEKIFKMAIIESNQRLRGWNVVSAKWTICRTTWSVSWESWSWEGQSPRTTHGWTGRHGWSFVVWSVRLLLDVIKQKETPKVCFQEVVMTTHSCECLSDTGGDSRHHKHSACWEVSIKRTQSVQGHNTGCVQAHKKTQFLNKWELLERGAETRHSGTWMKSHQTAAEEKHGPMP